MLRVKFIRIIFSLPPPNSACQSWKNKYLGLECLSLSLSLSLSLCLYIYICIYISRSMHTKRRVKRKLDDEMTTLTRFPLARRGRDDVRRSRPDPPVSYGGLWRQCGKAVLIARRFTWARDSSATPGSPGCGIWRGTPGGRRCSPTVEDRNPLRLPGSRGSPRRVSSWRSCIPGTCLAASICGNHPRRTLPCR